MLTIFVAAGGRRQCAPEAGRGDVDARGIQAEHQRFCFVANVVEICLVFSAKRSGAFGDRLQDRTSRRLFGEPQNGRHSRRILGRLQRLLQAQEKQRPGHVSQGACCVFF